MISDTNSSLVIVRHASMSLRGAPFSVIARNASGCEAHLHVIARSVNDEAISSEIPRFHSEQAPQWQRGVAKQSRKLKERVMVVVSGDEVSRRRVHCEWWGYNLKWWKINRYPLQLRWLGYSAGKVIFYCLNRCPIHNPKSSTEPPFPIEKKYPFSLPSL